MGCSKRVVRSSKEWEEGGSGLLGFAMFWGRSGLLASLGASAKAMASLSEDTAAVAARLAQASAQITVSVTTAALSTFESSLAISEELWRGIDLQNISTLTRIRFAPLGLRSSHDYMTFQHLV